MRALLIPAAASLAAIGALAIPAAPAEAEAGATVSARGDRGHGGSGGDVRGDFRHGDRDLRDHRRFRGGLVFLDYGGPRLHREERVDDWWHDKPWRAYPRWMQGNRNCERIWWSGGGWRC